MHIASKLVKVSSWIRPLCRLQWNCILFNNKVIYVSL